MSVVRIHTGWIVLVFAAVCLFALGCRDSDTTEEETAPSRTPESPVPTELGAPPGEPPATNAAAIRPADGQDDPTVPFPFPGSGQVAGWIKTQPARAALGHELEMVIRDEERVTRWKPYQIALIATGEYKRPRGPVVDTAQVQLVEARSAEDAFGLYSIEAGGASPTAESGRAQMLTSGGMGFSAWEGRYFVRLIATLPNGQQAQEAVDACEALLSEFLSVLPQESRPDILDLLPAVDGLEPVCWLSRSARSLTGPGAPLASTIDPAEMDQWLSLNPDTLLAVAAYHGVAGAATNLLWIVRYELPEEAQEAYRRCRAHVEEADDPVAANMLLSDPKGRFLSGTWTAEEESIMHLLPRVRALLP